MKENNLDIRLGTKTVETVARSGLFIIPHPQGKKARWTAET